MRNLMLTSALALALAGCATVPAAESATDTAATNSAEVAVAPLGEMIEDVKLDYETFTLDNGLEVVVHTDRKAPIVGVTTYYRVGSKHEPRGRTGFAHLFEHIMFTGSENVDNFDIPLEAAGSTSTNGSTNFDRTNYVETVPTGALDLALMMESDRMGYLLGAVDQAKLDKQRGVVQNEKRQGDNQPYGLTFYALLEGLFPVGHPYRHSVIGSMADLDAASLGDVHQWFKDNYGPNNVVLVLTGDIDAATARPKVERWFGSIPAGPEVRKVEGGPVTLAADKSREIADQVPLPRVYRAWSGPAQDHPDAIPLALGFELLGSLNSSRLDKALVREEQLAVSVGAFNLLAEDVSIMVAQMDVKPGVDRATAEARLDALIAELVESGPEEEELKRAATSLIAQAVNQLEAVGDFGGKGIVFAEGALFNDDPGHYLDDLRETAATTPGQVREALQRWLTRPVFKLAIVPGERTEDGATMGGWGDEATVPPEPSTNAGVVQTASGEAREMPPVEPVGALTFPTTQSARLSNGVEVTLARRTAVPKVLMSIEFDAGLAADGAARAGTQSLMMEMLEQGTTTRSVDDIAEEQELLGASISTGTSVDRSTVTLDTLSANLAPSLELVADIVRNPAFNETDVARVRDQRLAAIAQQIASPIGLAQRVFGPIVYGRDHPYGSVGASGERDVVSSVTTASLADAHRTWLRPDNMRVTVVGDVEMANLLPALEAAFGDWQAPAGAPPAKQLDAPVAQTGPAIYVLDRPNSPQSVLLFGRALPLTGRDQGLEALELANEVIGNGFLSRINMNLREEKGWSYGARSNISDPLGPRALTVFTRVQSDRTGDSIQLILDEMRAFPSTRGVDAVELQRVTDGNIRNLPNRYQTNAQVLGALLDNQRLGRPADYQSKLPDLYRAIDAASLEQAATRYLRPDQMAIIVVGDRGQIDSQIAGLGLPVTYLDPETGEVVDSDVSSAD
ncbi:pitrilysin family protein [Altererythrobacter arenosus]|uniref:Pitrilysin family protein n=1 Tax=Altererythrobacter arenosus TaxID=3032592 RepID=A0ABY8FSS9_9SPHN|nr:pitrilysin family protein [Altererythrobacter sp. CAU 1644]WFL78068.1 pitrilysin family protein [Altererythrobacter sp. CAU 1644]